MHKEFPCGLIVQATPPSKSYGQEVVEYKGMYYILSETKFPYKSDKTVDNEYFILTLFALVKECEATGIRLNGKDIIISAGLPPADFGSQAESFRKYFLSEGKFGTTLKYQGKEITFYIKNVILTPQNFAAITCFKPKLLSEYKTVYSIDFGDETVDLLVMRNKKPDLKVEVSDKSGIGVLRAEIINAVQRSFGYQLDDDTVEQVLRGQKTVLPGDVVEYITQIKRDWLQKIINKLHAYVQDFRINPTIFLGGGCLMFKDLLEQSDEFSVKEFITDTKANAIGYQVIGESLEKR